MAKLLFMILLSSALAGCATAPQVLPPSVPAGIGAMRHTVKAGETLYGISRMYGVDIDLMTRANHLQDSSTISNGQTLIIPKTAMPKAESAYPVVAGEGFSWPVRGYSVLSYGASVGRVINKGIDITVREGADVRASRAGRIVYCDFHMRGYGKTIIIDHGDGYQTVYAYNSELLVKVGDLVRQNDVIARVGRTGRTREPALHFEIRKNGQTRNPEYFLSH